MKTFRYAIFLMLIALQIQANSALAQFALSVSGGYGSGNFAAVDNRFIAARTPLSSEVFSHWQNIGGIKMTAQSGRRRLLTQMKAAQS